MKSISTASRLCTEISLIWLIYTPLFKAMFIHCLISFIKESAIECEYFTSRIIALTVSFPRSSLLKTKIVI
jgi:hypothetical protein